MYVLDRARIKYIIVIQFRNILITLKAFFFGNFDNCSKDTHFNGNGSQKNPPEVFCKKRYS